MSDSNQLPPNIVTNRSVGYYDSTIPLKIYNTTIDLDKDCSPNDIVIRVKAAALNPVDLVLYKISSPIPILNRFTGNNDKLNTFGFDYAGEIIKVGSDQLKLQKWQVGDLVHGLLRATPFEKGKAGSLTYYLILDPTNNTGMGKFSILPREISQTLEYNDKFVIAASWQLVFQTAYLVLHGHGQVPSILNDKDSSILVLGAATAVGDALVQIAKNVLKIPKVIGTCSSNSIKNRDKLIHPGFDYLIPYDDPNMPTRDHILKYIKDNNNEKFDLIADCVGSSDVVDIPYQVLRDPKTSVYSTLAGDKKIKYGQAGKFDMLQWRTILRLLTRRKIFNNYPYCFNVVKGKLEAVELANKMISEGTYIPKIDSVYSFDNFEAAVARLTSNKAKGKVVVTMD
ncbi:hypothetical protein TBLA_0A10410 [Henningerozyma blattae CBS 6284]|uniref:Alcohol dehydrogenase-like N-terminal domain-containing protein n=1 Tax=Henningerozyma blattae (strain ATCC 34711 / CBS 6284 / DSM 70876 / NBRC 10599 / NRRL Y-10934 / UCD 77-7) TaxID=1071380 RepID=I2GXG7_HENB6|nr:hypothetical protein TBLA_0A10410 [Tetrapisispora blattae CBS 6284]CCH58819.1 hypothetical protein TBLA_0A10410 [Tetrapisispora blattae CBS 6284]